MNAPATNITGEKWMELPQGRVISLDEMKKILAKRPRRDISIPLTDVVSEQGRPIKIGSLNTPPGGRRPRRNMDSSRDLFHTLPDGSWQGARCFIVGGGPSLERFDWSQLQGELVIGCNRALEYCDPTINLCVDYRMYEAYTDLTKNILVRDHRRKHPQEAYRAFKGMKAFMRIGPGPFDPSVYTMGFADNDCLTRTMKDGLGVGENTGFAALNLAMCLGCTEIYLLGFDMKGAGDNQANYHPGYIAPQKGFIYKSKFARYFEKYAPEIKSRGVRVVNVNDQSELTCFPVGNFPPLIQRPLYVSCYTQDTLYEQHARDWVKSLQRFGLEHHVEPYESTGDWKNNTRKKPAFIRRMMQKFPDRQIVWLDIDARVRKYPALFQDFQNKSAPVACFDFDPQEYVEGATAKKHLANGTLYLSNCPYSKDFVHDWVNNTTRDPDGTDLTSFHKTAKEWQEKTGFTIYNIPPEYCKIASLMPDVEPVIEHLQASRQSRMQPRVDQAVAKNSEWFAAEQILYGKAWGNGHETKSQCAVPMARYVASRARRHDKILEFGCGDLTTLGRLHSLGLNVHGMDITPMGWSNAPFPDGVRRRQLHIAALWDLPFADDEFDFTFSTDVLEHLPPEYVLAAIREIYRVTKRETHHVIACFPHVGLGGELFHKTVQPIPLWQDAFRSVYDFSPPGVTIMDRTTFMGEDFDRE